MTSEKMFEKATRKRFRFPFKGQIGVEELWQLSVEDLDSIFKTLNSLLKQVTEESLLQERTASDVELGVKIEIIKYIVGVKKEEANASVKAKENREKKNRILEVLAAKQDESLKNKTQEELEAMLNDL